MKPLSLCCLCVDVYFVFSLSCVACLSRCLCVSRFGVSCPCALCVSLLLCLSALCLGLPLSLSISYPLPPISSTVRTQRKGQSQQANNHCQNCTMVVCVPGDKLGEVGEFQSGPGTYVLSNFIFASVVGLQRVRQATEASGSGDKGEEQKKPIIEIVHDKPPSLVPQLADLVTARVTKINTRFASVEILTVGNKVLSETFPGTIRTRDVREFEIDSVEIHKSFRPGDIVRATVISLGDSKSYYLSTAKNELGVVLANSIAGATMVPISWQEMQCPLTGAKEMRKVAKTSTE